MRISIAMATYNGSSYVDEQLASLAAQTRLPDELVVCDDCSTDDTPAKIAAFAERSPFAVRLERQEQNSGSTKAFGVAIAGCSGDLIFLSDQDDVWRPEKARALEQVFLERGQVGAAFSNGRVVDAAGRSLEHSLWDGLMFGPSEQAQVRSGRVMDVFVKHVVAAGCTLAFRSVYRDLYLPLPDLHDCHDSWISLLIASVAEVALVDRELIDYRVHGSNQFGLRKLSLREQLDKARWQIEENLFDYGARFFGLALERCEASARAVDPRVTALLQAKIEHCQRRRDMSANPLRRVPEVAGEFIRGNYGRFSYGLKSVAQDLLLR